MGRKRKYATKEEALAAQKESMKRYYTKKTAEKGREGLSNPCKHKRLKYTGIRVDIGTLDRIKLDTAYIEISVTVSYINDSDTFTQFKSSAHQTFLWWLDHQDMWDRKNRIDVMDYDKINKKYKGTYKALTFQYHVRRDETTDWKSTAENLTGLAEALIETIKKTCADTGLVLIDWAPNSKVRKLSAAAGLAEDATPSATEED